MVCDHIVVSEGQVLLGEKRAGGLFLDEAGERPVGEEGAGGLLGVVGKGQFRGSGRGRHDVDDDLLDFRVTSEVYCVKGGCETKPQR